MHVHRAGVVMWVLPLAPDPLQQVGPAEHLGRVRAQERQQLELLVGELDLLAAQPHAAASVVHDQAAAGPPRGLHEVARGRGRDRVADDGQRAVGARDRDHREQRAGRTGVKGPVGPGQAVQPGGQGDLGAVFFGAQRPFGQHRSHRAYGRNRDGMARGAPGRAGRGRAGRARLGTGRAGYLEDSRGGEQVRRHLVTPSRAQRAGPVIQLREDRSRVTAGRSAAQRTLGAGHPDEVHVAAPHQAQSSRHAYILLIRSV